MVAQRGLRVVAITDHDSTEGLAEAMRAAKAFPQLEVIPGIELSTDVPKNEIHILGYFIDARSRSLQDTLERFREGRETRAKKMVERLGQMGVRVQWERVKELAQGGAVGRPHIALAMVEKGYIKEPQEAFKGYIGRNDPAYAEREKLVPSQAIRLIGDAGGLAVLAHPGELPDLESIVGELKAAGLVGMEVYYAVYPDDKINALADIAFRHGLLSCGGSDYHGLGNTGEPLPGDKGPPLDVVGKLRRLLERRR
jgi:hypothetical protein